MKTGFKQILNALFVLLLGIFFSTFGKYILIYQENHALFLFDNYYFAKFIHFPGGLTEYLAAFFIQFNYFPILGACITALLLGAIALITQKIIASFSQKSYFLSYFPSIIFLFFFSKPEFGIALPIAFLLNLLFLFFFTRIKTVSLRYIFAFFVLLLMYISTAGVFYVFWVSAILFELFFQNTKSKKVFILIFTLLALTLPAFVGLNIYNILLSTSYFRLLGDSFVEMPFLFYVLMGFYFVLPALLFLFRNRTTDGRSKLNKPSTVAIGMVAVLLLTGITLYHGYNRKVDQMICTANAARSNNWEQVLKLSSEYEGSNYLMAYYTNLALFNKGEMDNRLLEFNQELGTNGLFFTWDRSRKKSEHGGLLYFDLGFINEAHHWAFESLISNGENAEQLKMLALTNLINGKRKSAAKYLRKLEKSLFYSKWANEYLLLANDSTQWAQNAFIQQKRKQLPNTDFFMNLNNLAPDLVQLLQSNPKNKAALSYLLSYYLLSNQVNLFAETLKEFHLPNQPISELQQQALLIFLSAHPSENENYKQFRIDSVTKQKFTSYARSMRSDRPKRGNIPAGFKKEFGTTYWYYLHFVSPHGNKVITK